MIQINLLIKPKPTNWKRIGQVVGGTVVVAALGFYLFWWGISYRSLLVEVKSVQGLVTDYQAKLAGEPALKAKEEKAAKEEAALQQLSQNQRDRGQSTLLRGVLAAAPNGVAVTGVAFKPDGTIELSGQAGSFQAAMAFKESLRTVPKILSVADKSVTSTSTGSTTFSLVLKADRGVSK